MKLSFDSVLVGWGWLYNIVIIGLLFTFVGNMVTWSIGANHSMAATGLDKTAPGVFGHVNRRFKTPDYTFVLWGVVATIVTLLNYALFGTKENIFWTIFALSSIVFLLPYLLMFPSLIVLRFKRPDQPRPYVVPLGRLGVWLWPLLCEAGIVFTLVLFFWVVPEDVPRSTFWGITVGGTIVSILIGWWLSLRSRARDK